MALTTLTTLKKLPSVLAFNRCHVVTDAEMFSRMPDGTDIPIPVVRHGIRGTQNVNDGKGNDGQKVATGGERHISNPQITESAKLDSKADALVIRFGVGMLDIGLSLDSCVGTDKENGRMMRATVKDFVDRAKVSNGIMEVALRYARNLANGRWLWRNRTIAGSIEITVSKKLDGTKLASFDAKSVALNQFDKFSPGEHAVAAELVAQMRGDSFDGLTVEAVINMRVPGNVEVFPSQNYVEKKPKGFSRPLYKIGHPEPFELNDPSAFAATRITGYAAIRDQKIFNAIRTIDTWYPAHEDTGFPIPVEPLGANLSQQEFYRAGKQSSFEMFKRLVQIDPNTPEGMYCIAALDRGGVYGEADKSDKAAANATAEVAA